MGKGTIGMTAPMLIMLALSAPLLSSSLLAIEPSTRIIIKPPTASVSDYRTGVAKYYRSGLMERVAARRGLLLGKGTGFVTHPDCSMIGRYMMVSVQNPKTGRWSGWERKRVADCSQPRDYSRHVKANQVEFSYADAKKYNFAVDGKTSVRWYLE